MKTLPVGPTQNDSSLSVILPYLVNSINLLRGVEFGNVNIVFFYKKKIGCFLLVLTIEFLGYSLSALKRLF